MSFKVFVGFFLCQGAPKGSTSSGSDFKAHQKTGSQLKISHDRLGEAGIGKGTHGRDKMIPFKHFKSNII